MTPEEIVNGNNSIAEFTGLKKNERGMYNIGLGDFGEEALSYHRLWESIMPVVEKIEQGNYGVKMCRKVVEIYFDDTKEIILKEKKSSRIESLWFAIVRFLEWHKTNSNK